ncbi:MAG: type II secretion system major pseudopilin GspG [Pirellulales bacterium]
MLSRIENSKRAAGRRARRDRAGFTLIELLLVLAILVVLASMVVTMFSGTQEKALKDAAKGQVGIFKSAINLYKFHTRNYPSDLSALTTKPSDANVASRWAGPYLDAGKVPLDPWDRDYRFVAPGKHNADSFDVWSVGPDGQDGTDDDIGNWEI